MYVISLYFVKQIAINLFCCSLLPRSCGVIRPSKAGIAPLGRLQFERSYSYFSAWLGFTQEARTECRLTVTHAIIRAITIEPANTPIPRLIL